MKQTKKSFKQQVVNFLFYFVNVIQKRFFIFAKYIKDYSHYTKNNLEINLWITLIFPK